MRYYLDTEFSERPNTIELISLGLVADDGRELYCVSGEFDDSRLNQWVRAHVIPALNHPDDDLGPRTVVPYDTIDVIARKVRSFVGSDPNPEFWGYFADYDWVVFCWLFGAMVDLPRGWPMYCRDLKQNVDQFAALSGVDVTVGIPPARPEHNALADARWDRALHRHLKHSAQDFATY